MEVYYCGQSMIATLDNFDPTTLRDVLWQPQQSWKMDYVTKIFYEQLAASLPDFLNQTVEYWGDSPSFFKHGMGIHAEIGYRVPLQQGRVSGKMTLIQDLAEYVNTPRFNFSGKDTLAQRLSGKNGIIVQGCYRAGKDINQDFYLRVNPDGLSRSAQELVLFDESFARAMLNAFCQLVPLDMQKEVYPHHFGPISYQNQRVCAKMKDLRLEKLKEAEPSVDEFFQWIRSHEQEIHTILVMSKVYHNFQRTQEALQQLHKQAHIKLGTRSDYTATPLESITAHLDMLHPPQNRRMEYLVSSL